MKILFVHDHVFVTKDGKVYANSFSYQVLKRYVDMFSDVTVLARHREVSEDELIELPLASGEGVTFVFLESIASVSSFFGLRQEHEKQMIKIVQEHDAVIARVPSELGLMAAKVAHTMHKPYMLEVVGCAWDAMWNYGTWQSKVYAPFLYVKVKHAVKEASYVTYVTEQFLQKRYPTSTEAETIGVSDVQLPEADNNTLLRRMQKIETMGGKRIFGTIGTLHVGYKGIETAIRTLAEMKHESNDFEYRVLGSGDPLEYRQLAEELGIGDNVFFDGTLSEGKAVYDWLDTLDVYLQPSFQEGLPRALLEAMSRGCPAIGSSAGGIPELLEAKMIFDHKNPGQFSDLIEDLIDDKQLMLDAAKYNFDKARAYQKDLLDEKRIAFWTQFRDATEA